MAASLGPELTPSEVARKYAISSGLLYSWRQQVLGGQARVVCGSAPSFAQVELAPVLHSLAGGGSAAPADPDPLPAGRSGPDGLIEIVQPSGVLVRVDAATCRSIRYEARACQAIGNVPETAGMLPALTSAFGIA